MQTVDIHVHLLNSEVRFNRLYDKVAITLFGRKLGVDPKELFKNPYKAYTNALSKNPNNFNNEYFKLLWMLSDYDNLYADISALLTPVRAKVLPHLKEQTQIHNKLLFGTDYPVPFSTIFTSYDLPLKKRLEIERDENTFDRYIRAILEYFPENSPIYTNYKKILKL